MQIVKRGKVGTEEQKSGRRKVKGKKTFVFFMPISEQQISESVSCVLTQSSTRGSFVRHITSLVHRKSKALFMENLIVNVPRSLRTRREFVAFK